ncbi:MAG: hypothetical protein JSV00_03330 [bacterium]|nr:MAG: hypothetical protein JSV00_03330 [bacterium]
MKKNLGQLLVESGLVTEKVLADALQRQVIFGGRLGTNLLEMGAVSEEALMKLLALQWNVPYAEPHHFESIPRQVLDSVPRELLAKNCIIPLGLDGKRITLAMREPQRLDVADEVAFRTNKIVKPVIASELRIVQALEKYYDIRREARYIAATPEVVQEQQRVTEAPGKPAQEIPEEPEVLDLTEEDLEPLDPFDVSDINQAFFTIRNREEVAQTIIRAGLRFMDDVFMFIIKGEEALGWMSGGSARPVVDFGSMAVPIRTGNAFHDVRESRTLERFGGVDIFESNQWLKELSTKVPKEVTICPLVLKKHMVSALVGFRFKSPISEEETAFLIRVLQKASVAFEILIMRSRILML